MSRSMFWNKCRTLQQRNDVNQAIAESDDPMIRSRGSGDSGTLSEWQGGQSPCKPRGPHPLLVLMMHDILSQNMVCSSWIFMADDEDTWRPMGFLSIHPRAQPPGLGIRIWFKSAKRNPKSEWHYGTILKQFHVLLVNNLWGVLKIIWNVFITPLSVQKWQKINGKLALLGNNRFPKKNEKLYRYGRTGKVGKVGWKTENKRKFKKNPVTHPLPFQHLYIF